VDAVEVTIGSELPPEVENWHSCSPFHTQKWANFTEHTMGLPVGHALITADQRIAGYVPIITRPTPSKLKKCGPLVAGTVPQLIFSDDSTEQLEKGIRLALCEAAISALVLGNDETSSTSGFILNLTGSFEDYWSETVSAKAKYDVRKSERESLKTTFLGAQGLNSFYPLYLRRMRELGSPGLSKKIFSSMAETFNKELQFAVTKSGDEIVAASILFSHKGRWMGHPWSVSHSEFRGTSVNYGHYRDIIRYGFDHGFSVFSMGPSLANSPWCPIKRRFGALEYPIVCTDGLPVIHATQRLSVRLIGGLIKRSPPALYRLYAPWLAAVASKYVR